MDLEGARPPVPSASMPQSPRRGPEEDTEQASSAPDGMNFFGKDGFDFWDLVDVINPLQHIPIVNTIYREMTGDETGHVARVAGSTLFFGPIGGGFALANAMVDEATGREVNEHVLAAFGLEDDQDTQSLADTALNKSSESDLETFFDLKLDPVSAWAREEVGHTNGTGESLFPIAAPETLDPLLARGTPYAVPAAESPAIDVTTWAQQEIAFAQGTIPAVRARASEGTGEAALDKAVHYPEGLSQENTPEGAIAPVGGWFTEVGLTDWVRRESLLRQETPTYRPEMAVAAYQGLRP